jgi:hypothetical protein
VTTKAEAVQDAIGLTVKSATLAWDRLVIEFTNGKRLAVLASTDKDGDAQLLPMSTGGL